MEKIFTQKEIHELRQIASDLNFPMELKLKSSNKVIDFDYSGTIFFQSILKKDSEGYKMDFVNSQGENAHVRKTDWNQFKYFIKTWVSALKRENPFYINKEKNIDQLSPNFYSLFLEAIMINNLGFKESSGMIFRRSLEIIVKDYLKSVLPEEFQKVVDRKTIGSIVHEFYDIDEEDLQLKNNQKFKNIRKELIDLKSLFKVIRNTFQIGNDFSHYERRLKDYNSDHMQSYIEKITEYISHHIQERKSKSKRALLDEDFKSQRLI